MKTKAQLWPAIIAIIALILAIGNQPYDFYTLLRWGIAAIGIYYSYLFYKKDNGLYWVFGGVAILFNPIIPFYFTKASWQFIDFITAAVFALCIYFLNKNIKTLNN